MKNDFKNILNQLRELPEGTRVKLALIICFFSVFGLFSLWVKKTSDKFVQLDINKPSAPDKIEVTALLNNVKSGIANLRSILQENFNHLFSFKQPPYQNEISNSNPLSKQPKPLNPNDFPQLPLSD